MDFLPNLLLISLKITTFLLLLSSNIGKVAEFWTLSESLSLTISLTNRHHYHYNYQVCEQQGALSAAAVQPDPGHGEEAHDGGAARSVDVSCQ